MNWRNDKASDIQLQRIKEYSEFFGFDIQQPLTKGDCCDIINIFVKKKMLCIKNGFINGTSIKAFNKRCTYSSNTEVLSGHESPLIDYRGGAFLDKFNSHSVRNDSDVTIKEWKRQEENLYGFYPIDFIK